MSDEIELYALDSIPLDKIVRQEYRAYQIYTLMDRAIPHIQDGLKPVQRRILFTLWKNQKRGLIKVSSATGLVLTVHPHGPASIESSIVNLAQDYTFSNNCPLLGKKGYFGERMETTPAAARYIECKLSEIAEYLLFDDINQVKMIPNYDETVMEPEILLPKIPIMLLNGSEGIGTGFSSVIPSFNYKDICDSLISYIKNKKCKKLSPYVRNYKAEIEYDKNRYLFKARFEEIDGKIFITELPKGYDSQKIYRVLNNHMESDFIKDYIDHSVDNDIMIELIFKRGSKPLLEEVEKKIKINSYLAPNYTLISERGVCILNRPEDIIETFGEFRLEVVKNRYKLLCKNLELKIKQNNEIIKFIKNKEYEIAVKSTNRKSFVDYLKNKRYNFYDYLADMPIYRMTKDEVSRRKLLVNEDKKSLAEFKKIVESRSLVKQKLIEELEEVKEKISIWLEKQYNSPLKSEKVQHLKKGRKRRSK